ncbi:ATP-binding cassette domain-containing protein [Pedobacter sp.]|uniref:ATP-binding cassette domain-containing protein n=1 Tax=Pedobacter sp. TaxID=1411316 RepID=UPI003D7F4EE2
MIKATELVKRFGSTTAVNKVSFEVSEGENMILLGPSGCGKTTTLRMINQLETPDAGQVYINRVDVAEQQPEQLRRSIGYVLQHHGLFPHYTVAENVAIVPRLLKWDTQRIVERSAALFEKLDLDPGLQKQYPKALSGGQQQRVGLARALMTNPPVLLMDEPFGALDNLTRIRIRKDFMQLDELRQLTIVMVTHDIQEAFEMADKICLMDKGVVMQFGTPEELLHHPANDFVTDFLKDQRLLLELKSLHMGEQTAWEKMESLNSTDLQQLIKGERKP